MINVSHLDLSAADRKRYSLSRALLSLAGPKLINADFERECSAEISRRYCTQPHGLYIPADVFAVKERALTTSTADSLVENKLLAGDFIELLRNETRVLQLGATTLPDQVGNVVIPSQTGAASVEWISEDGAATESDQSFGQVISIPHTLAACTTYSRLMMLQATPAIDGLIRDDLTRTVGVEIDRVAVSGSGVSGQPTGILQTAGINPIPLGTNGGAPTWQGILQMIQALADANALRGKLGFLTNPAVIATLENTPKIGTTYPRYLLDEPYDTLVGYPVAQTNNIPGNLTKGTGTNLSAMVFANWADLIIPFWGPPLDLLTDPYSLSTSGAIQVVAFASLDIQLRHPASFAVTTDMVTT